MRCIGALPWVMGLAAIAHAGEVHTRAVGGTWTPDTGRGTVIGTVANDAGYSFWIGSEQVTLDAPVTIIAQVRYRSRIDYGGAGVALIDPNATNQTQKNLRIELSEREDTAGVGGWLGNENHYPGASQRAAKDITVGEWHELALKVDGIHASGFLDGTQVFDADVPEIRQLPKTLTVAPFVVEADAEIRVIVRRGAAPLAPARIASIEPYGHDETDGSEVYFESGLPHPSMDDDPARTNKPNAEWDASYDLKGDRLCVRVASLRTPFPPIHTIAIGYKVTLDGAIFDTGTRTKTIVITKFSGTPLQATAGTCETVTVGGTPREAPPPTTTVPPPLPASGHISDLLPKRSKTQVEIEKLFAAKVASATGPADYRAMYDHLEELILVVGGKFHFLLEPVSRQWHVYNRVHDTWEPTGFFAGDAAFSVVRGKLKVTKKRKGVRS